MTREDRDKILELAEEYRVSSLAYHEGSKEGEAAQWLMDDVTQAYLQLKNYLTALVYRK